MPSTSSSLRRTLLVAAIVVTALSMLPAAASAADRSFGIRWQTHTRGNLTTAANTLMSCSTSTSGCANARNGVGGILSLINSGTMAYVDADADGSTFNSSSATLSVPAGGSVAWAGLYWGGDSTGGSGGAAPPAPAQRATVRLDTPAAGGYSTITASQVDTSTPYPNRFQAYADVTSQVQAAGSGDYWAANVQAGTGGDRYAGWTLVVAYRLATEPVRNLSVYDGMVSVESGSTPTATLSGFEVPASGTVTASLGLTAWEGELGWTDDPATLNGTTLSDGANPADNFFNASISANGSHVTTKTPNYVNQFGFDSDVFTGTGLVTNGATSATLGMSSAIDVYHVGVATFAVNQIPEVPVNSAAPGLSGTPTDGQTLTASPGTWNGTTLITYSYQWQRCDSAGANCANIGGATGTTYTLTAADVGSRIRAVVTATNTEGTGTASSAASSPVQAIPPSNTALPAISGTTQDGQTLTASTGTFSGSAPFAYSYQWRRCDSAGMVCSDIAGATGSTYTLTSADVASRIRVAVTATNGGGSATAISAATGPVTALPPANTAVPALSGTATDGQTINATAGTWTGSTPMSFAYQWQRCNGSGAGCANIAGATGSSYALVSADIGTTVRVVVTATNSGGSDSANSAISAVVAAQAPVNTAVPTFSGTARDGSTLSGAAGSWTGSPTITYAYQWQRCDSEGAGCANIAGATDIDYTLTDAEVDGTVRLVVTATNGAGSAAAGSAPSATVAALAASNTAPPTISGTARDGSTLTASNGTWSGTAPLAFSYQWRRCDSAGLSCSDIAGATGSAYDLVPADVDSTIRVVVTATNGAGPQSASSAQTAQVEALPPVNTTAPSITGTARDGRSLSATPGSWAGTPVINHAYQWQRCDSAGGSCSDLPGATSSSYPLGPADVGTALRVVVTATNAAGSASAGSAASTEVLPQAPVNDSAPTLSGTARDGQTLAAGPGSWRGTPTITYQWQRCDADGSSCTDITGAAGSTYELVPADVGKRVRAFVTATNGGGSNSANTPLSAVVEAIPPANTSVPTTSGTLRDGSTLTAANGSWTGTAPLSYAYQWQRCDADGSNCANIAGATEATYELRGADVDHAIRVVVTATNPVGAASAGSAPTAPIDALAPSNAGVPTVSGPAREGQTLTAANGDWTGTGPIAFTYQWQRCDAGGLNCSDIAGATASTYELGAADVGNTVRVVVTGTNGEGTATAASAPTAVVGVAAAPPAPSPPASPPRAPAPAPAPIADLSSVRGSMLAATACQQAGGGRQLPFYVPGGGQLRIRVAPNGVITKGAPMIARAVKPRRKVTKKIKAVTYTLNGRRLASKGRAPYSLEISPALLSAATRHTLVVAVVPKKGKPRPAVVSLSSEPCPDLFSVLHRPNRRASMLGLRVDTRRGVRSVTFRAPARLLARPGTTGSAGQMRLGIAGQPSRKVKLTFPRRKSKVATLVAARGGPQVTVRGGSVTVTGLPAGTGIVELKLKGRGLRRTPKATLRAAIQTDAGNRALQQKLGVRR